MCGKEQSNTHINGIDRIDNSNGYTDDNTSSCCGDCNYLKKDNDYVSIMDKLKIIYEYQKVQPIREHPNKSNKHIVIGNKLTMDEKTTNGILRKTKKREELVEKYTNEITRKKWIDEIVKHKKHVNQLQYFNE